jgi:hypothetical protein
MEGSALSSCATLAWTKPKLGSSQRQSNNQSNSAGLPQTDLAVGIIVAIMFVIGIVMLLGKRIKTPRRPVGRRTFILH